MPSVARRAQDGLHADLHEIDRRSPAKVAHPKSVRRANHIHS
jgi:hypothetical protein